MKNSILLHFSIVITILLSASCTKNIVKCEIPIQFKEIDFSNYPNIQIVNQNHEDMFFVINSQEDFNKVILNGLNGENININFDAYTLLIGKKVIGGVLGNLIKQSVSLNCDSTKLTYNILIKNGGYTALGNFIYGVIIPKSKIEVSLNINTE